MALWSDLAEWRGPTPNRTRGGMNRYDGQVTHIAAGWYEGTISWQLNDSSNVSSHFVVGREWGECAQLVDTADAAWTQGEGNGEWISVENEGFPSNHPLYRPGWDLLSDWQIECNARLYARGHREFGWPLRLTNHPEVKGLGYHGMGAENGYRWGHLYCPGEPIKAQLPLVLTRAIEIVNGDDMALKDEKLTLPAETLANGERVPATGTQETVDGATALAYALRNAYAARRAAESALKVALDIAARPPVQPAPVDPAVLRAVVEPLLAAMELRLDAKFRDAVADLGEGGAAAVRAES